MYPAELVEVPKKLRVNATHSSDKLILLLENAACISHGF